MSLGEKYKQWNEPKISSLPFEGGRYAVLAISGSLESARCFQEIAEGLAEQTVIVHPRSVANVCEDALKKTRSKLLKFIDDPQVTAEERQQHLINLNFEGLLAYFEGTPPRAFIYRLDLGSGLAIRSKHTFEAIGCGSDVAGFILTGGDLSTYSKEEAIALAFYVVEACKKFDQACGGPVQYMFLKADPKSHPSRESKELTEIFGDAVKATDEEIQNLITQIIMSKIHDAYVDLLQKGESP